MKKRFNILIIMVLTLLLGITSVNAEVNSAKSYADEDLTLTENVNGNTFVLGNKVRINSIINGIGFALGESIDVNGVIDYGFILGKDVIISNEVRNDAFILSEKTVIDGVIDRDLYILTGTLEINGTVNRDIYVYAGEILIGDSSVINGTIHYNDDVVIEGDTSNIQTKTYETIQVDEKEEAKEEIIGNLYLFVKLVVVLVVLILLIPKLFDNIKKNYNDKKVSYYFKNIGYGFIFLIGVPILILILLMLSNLGGRLGLILLLLYILGLSISNIFTGYVIGLLIDKKLLKKNNQYLTGIIGIFIVILVNLIPLVSIFTLTLGLGTILNIYLSKRSTK